MSFFSDLKLKRELKKYSKTSQGVWKDKQKKTKKNKVFFYIILLIVIGSNYYFNKFTNNGIIIYILTFFSGVIFELFDNSKNLKDQLRKMGREQEYIEERVTSNVKREENISRAKIKHLILKDDQGYDIKTWKIENCQSLLIGKDNSKNKIDIDLAKTAYSSLISREHAVLNKTEEGWFFEDLGSMNGSGVEKKDTGRKIKVSLGKSIKLESGDLIYISNTKLLLS